MAKTTRGAQKWISAKIRKISKEGLRGKPGEEISKEQKVAVALNMARREGYKVPKKKKGNPHINDNPEYQGPGYHVFAGKSFHSQTTDRSNDHIAP